MKNKRRICEVPDCDTPSATHYFRFCRLHQNRFTRTGHPLGKMVRRSQLKQEIARADEQLQVYRSRPAVQAALEWTHKLLTTYDLREVELSNQMQRLHTRGVTAYEMLCALYALWIYKTEQNHRLPDDARLTFACAGIALRLRAIDRRPTPGGHTTEQYVRRETRLRLGMMIREVLFPLFHQMYRFHLGQHERELELRKRIANFDESATVVT